VCDELQTHGAYITCRAMTLQDRAACSDLVGRPRDHEACIGYVADSRCVHEPSAEGADRCRMGLAVQWGSLRTCLFITDEDAKAACQAAVAKDPGRCSGIGDPALATACADAIRAGRPMEDLFEPAPSASGSPLPAADTSPEPEASAEASPDTASADQGPGGSPSAGSGTAGEGVVPPLPVTLKGTVSGFPKSAVNLTLDAAGASGTGKVDLTEDEVPGHATFAFRGTRESETTWAGTAHVVERRGGSKDDPILGLQENRREYDTGWRVTFEPDGIGASVEQWGDLQLHP
jgi:hypothetical protein